MMGVIIARAAWRVILLSHLIASREPHGSCVISSCLSFNRRLVQSHLGRGSSDSPATATYLAHLIVPVGLVRNSRLKSKTQGTKEGLAWWKVVGDFDRLGCFLLSYLFIPGGRCKHGSRLNNFDRGEESM